MHYATPANYLYDGFADFVQDQAQNFHPPPFFKAAMEPDVPLFVEVRPIGQNTEVVEFLEMRYRHDEQGSRTCTYGCEP